MLRRKGRRSSDRSGMCRRGGACELKGAMEVMNPSCGEVNAKGRLRTGCFEVKDLCYSGRCPARHVQGGINCQFQASHFRLSQRQKPTFEAKRMMLTLNHDNEDAARSLTLLPPTWLPGASYRPTRPCSPPHCHTGVLCQRQRQSQRHPVHQPQGDYLSSPPRPPCSTP